MSKEENNQESFRDSLATIDKKGERIWVYPKRPKGRYHNARRVVAVVLLFLLFSGPFIRIGGQPLMLLNVLERKFIVFGNIFWPQDFFVFVIVFITFIVFIILFTAVFGRLFCGWVCPQTIFMEMVFRKIEYWIEGDYTYQKKLNNAPWTLHKILKKVSKHSIFFGISFIIANTFLAYIVGSEALLQIIKEPPSEHIKGLISILVFSGLFYGVFAFFRDQVCTQVCPYGRLQGVMLDRNSMVVSYDYKRGEPRGKFRRGENRDEENKGDCIACQQCVLVCPTGIDIRNGTQLECVNCTACMDACDNVMKNVDLPLGLIRYASEEGIAKGTKFHLTGRSKAYVGVLIILMTFMSFLLARQESISTTILRVPGIIHQEHSKTQYSNLLSAKIINKSSAEMVLYLKVLEPYEGVEVKIIGDSIWLPEQGKVETPFFIIMDKKIVTESKVPVKIGIYNNKGEMLGTEKFDFIGPLQF